jgi:inner membrane protein
MFFFGHIGITLGSAVLVKGLFDAGRGLQRQRQGQAVTSNIDTAAAAAPEASVLTRGILTVAKWTESLGKLFDLRLLVLGSLLPDIIDKPVGIFFFGEGRIFTHSLLITLLFLVTAFYLQVNHKKTALLAVALGMAAHLVLDSMWGNPQVFLWPLYGWGFPPGVRTSYLDVWLNTLIHNPGAYLTEAIGLLILVVLTAALSLKREFVRVLVKGRL